jgi:phosphatidylglycerol:prolipoprotein diacylglycerol transferase
VIPYFELPQIPLGEFALPLHVLLIASAVLTGYLIFLRRARAAGLRVDRAQWFFVNAVSVGFLGAHLVKMLVYEREAAPLKLLAIFSGLSSFGGFLGAVAGAWIFKRRARIGDLEIAILADAALFAAPFGWFFGRVACALTHDHVGALSAHWLAVAYPGGARWNLGLIEAIYIAGVAALFLWLDRRPRPALFYCPLFCALYGPFRFWLDSLHERAPDAPWLTVDRLGSLLVLALSCVVVVVTSRLPSKGGHDESTKL